MPDFKNLIGKMLWVANAAGLFAGKLTSVSGDVLTIEDAVVITGIKHTQLLGETYVLASSVVSWGFQEIKPLRLSEPKDLDD